MMPRSLSQTGPEKRRFTWPKGTPQIIALLLVLLVDSLVAPHFYQVVLQDGRLFGSPIDILNRAAPVALLAIGMTLVIATGGIDLSVGAVSIVINFLYCRPCPLAISPGSPQKQRFMRLAEYEQFLLMPLYQNLPLSAQMYQKPQLRGSA